MNTKLKYIVGMFLGALFAIPLASSALSIFTPSQGGTGSGVIPSFGQILVGLTTGNYQASSSPTIAGTVTANNFVATSTASSTFPVFYSATGTVSNLNGVIYVDGVRFAKTGAGIQSALNFCSALGGGNIELTDGLYAVSSAITLKDNCNLYGRGTSTQLFLVNGANTNMFITPSTGLSNVSISGLNTDGNGANQSSAGHGGALWDIEGNASSVLKNIVIEKNWIKNSYQHALFITGDTTNRSSKIVRGNTIDNHGVGTVGFGIYVDYAPNTTIEGNTIKNSNGNDGIEMGHVGEIYTVGNYLYDGPIQYPFADNSKIIGNFVYKNTIQNDANKANNVIISNNYVYAQSPTATLPPDGYGAITVFGASSTVSNNQVYASRQAGIKITQGSGNLVIGNVITGPDSASSTMNGIYENSSRGNSFIGNIISGFGNGIALTGDSSLVTGNKVSTSTNGILMTTSVSSGHVMLSNIIYGNIFNDNVSVAINKTNQGSITNHYQWNEGDATSTQYVNSEILNTTDGYGLTFDRTDTSDNLGTAILFKYGGKLSDAAKILATKVSGGGGNLSFFTGNSAGSGSTERLTILRDGNIGVGNTNPAQKLNVQGTITGQLLSASSTTGTSTFLSDVSIDHTGTTDGSTANLLFSYNGGANKMGNINGIKVAGGGGNLEFYTGDAGGATLTKQITIANTGTSTHANGISLTTGCYAIGATCLQTFSNTLTSGGTATTTFYNGGIVFSDGSKLTQAGLNSSFFWDNSGLKLGIGTSSPTNKLTIANTLSGSDMNGILLSNYGTAANSNSSIEFQVGNLSTARSRILAVAPGGSDSELSFYTSNSNAAATEKVRINDIGNFGIGTTSPYAKLSVVGETVSAFFTATTTTATSSFAGTFYTTGDTFWGGVGKKAYVKVGTNQPFGTSTLVSGTVTVNNTQVRTDSLIQLTNCIAGGTLGSLSVGARVVNTSFVINSTNILDTSTVCYEIKQPVY